MAIRREPKESRREREQRHAGELLRIFEGRANRINIAYNKMCNRLKILPVKAAETMLELGKPQSDLNKIKTFEILFNEALSDGNQLLKNTQKLRKTAQKIGIPIQASWNDIETTARIAIDVSKNGLKLIESEKKKKGLA